LAQKVSGPKLAIKTLKTRCGLPKRFYSLSPGQNARHFPYIYEGSVAVWHCSRTFCGEANNNNKSNNAINNYGQIGEVQRFSRGVFWSPGNIKCAARYRAVLKEKLVMYFYALRICTESMKIQYCSDASAPSTRACAADTIKSIQRRAAL
jgi:hypothetical protein